MTVVGTAGTWSVSFEITLTYGSGSRSDREENTCPSFTNDGPSAAIADTIRSARAWWNAAVRASGLPRDEPALPVPQEGQDQRGKMSENDQRAHGRRCQKLGISGRAHGMNPASAASDNPNQIDAR